MKHTTRIQLLFTAMVVAGLLLAAVTPSLVFAEGDIPEAPPPEPLETGTIQPEGSITDVVELLAESGAVIVDGQGQGVPLASQSVLDAVCEPDPRFYCSACTGGIASYTTIAAALADWNIKKGYGYLYVEGGLTETIPILLIGSTMKGIVRDVKNWGATPPTIIGTLNVSGISTGFLVQGINFMPVSSGSPAISIISTGGRVKLTDVNVQSDNGAGIYINNKGPVDLLRVNSYNNRLYSAKVISTLGSVTVTNSSFNGSSETFLGDFRGLEILSAGAVTLNGISASFNTGDGLYVEHTGPLTIRNGVFTNNRTSSGGSAFGYGIRTWSTGPTGNVTIDNVIFSDNENAGALLSTVANITLKRVNAYDNDGAGVIIIKTPDEMAQGARNVSVLDSNFSDNGGTNLSIFASGSIILTNVYSGSSGSYGVYLANTFSTTHAPVIFNRSVVLKNKTNTGIYITSLGTVTLNGVTSSYHPSGNGAVIVTSGSAYILSSLGRNSFDNNGQSGLRIYAQGSIVLSNVQANANSAPTNDHAGIYIVGNGLSSNVTLGSITASDNHSYGVFVDTTGSVTWTKGVLNNNATTVNAAGGALIDTAGGILKPVRLTGVVVSNSTFGDGIRISSSGATFLTNITASGNQSGYGLHVNSLGAVTLTGVYNQFNKNNYDGVYIHDSGKVTLLNFEAQDNNWIGIHLEDIGDAVISASTAGWVNQVNANGGIGLFVYDSGAVNVNKVQANGNGPAGMYINNELAGITKGVILANITASDNVVAGSVGVYVRSLGSVTVSNITASKNALQGLLIDNKSDPLTPTGVTVSKGSFSLNGADGLQVFSYGKIALSNIISMLNTGAGVYANNQGSSILAPIAIAGVNQFSYNGSEGLHLSGSGNITATGITATDNASNGIYLQTNEIVILGSTRTDGNGGYGVGVSGVMKSVTVNNLFSVHNTVGLSIATLFGKLTVSNSIFAANSNYGLYALRNSTIIPCVLSNVTFLGNNNGGVQYLIAP